MKVTEIVRALEAVAPPGLAEEWDNVGLLLGDEQENVTKLMLCIDLTERVCREALRVKAQMVMAYHPVIFKPLSRISAATAPAVYLAARGGLAVYSMHTALDAAVGGANAILADVLGLTDRRPLKPVALKDQCKLVVFILPEDLQAVSEAAFGAGAGRVGGYHDCAFFSHGIGSFCGDETTRPTIGQPGEHEAVEELRLEMVVPRAAVPAVCRAVRAAQSYEVPILDVYPLEEFPEGCGLGRIGRLVRPVTVRTLITRIKKALGVERVSLATPARAKGDGKGMLVSRAACCAGSCGSIFRSAVAGGATFYLTGEMRHHDALEATAGGMTVACVGHSNSERLTLAHLADRLRISLSKLRIVLAEQDVDPFRLA